MNMPNPEKLADNTTLLVLSRISMLVTPFLISAILTLGWMWIDQKFDAQAAVSAQLRIDVNELNDEVPLVRERTKVLETNMDRGRADRERFQQDTTAKLDRSEATQTAMLQELAALRAIIESQQKQIDRRR